MKRTIKVPVKVKPVTIVGHYVDLTLMNMFRAMDEEKTNKNEGKSLKYSIPGVSLR